MAPPLAGAMLTSVHELSHCASAICAVPAEKAFAFLADVGTVGRWALGCWGAAPVQSGTVRGSSLFDGTESFVRVSADGERLVVDFEIGASPGELSPRISARVVPGRTLRLKADECAVTLTAWRTADMSDERWQQLQTAHEAEILLLRGCLEGGLRND